ncbi:MAG: CHASE3 domain-containing protein [Ferruginibacter sp.]
MERISHSRIKIIFLVTTVILIVLSLLSYLRIKNLVDTGKLVNHTQEVKLELEGIVAELTEAESSLRGYIISKDSTFLNAYYTYMANTDRRINKVTALTADNPLQQQSLIALRKTVHKKMEYMDRILDTAAVSTISQPQMLGGRALMNNVHKQTEAMEKEEQRLLEHRSELLTKEAFITPMFTIFLIVGAIIILVAAYIKITQELKISDRLKADVEKRTAELELAYGALQQKNEELLTMNKELESFAYISSHDLQEPLRKIQTFANRIMTSESQNLTDKAKSYFLRIEDAANRMQTLIADLLAYSRTSTSERNFESIDLNKILEDVKKDFEEIITEKNAVIETGEMCHATVIPFQFHQLMHNIIGNSLKFSNPGIPSHIIVTSRKINATEVKSPQSIPGNKYCHISIADNGIGFEPEYKDYIFELFKRLHDKAKIEGTGIGLTIVKKIIENHNGIITAKGELNKGAIFDIYIPVSGVNL